jgi:nitronate monooxygenase
MTDSGAADRLQTPLCDLLGLDHPVVQAPIGSATTPELAAAVSEVGALGTLAVTWRDLEETRAAIEATAERTDRPFGVNLVLDEAARQVPTDEHLAACLEAGAPLVWFSFGDATGYLEAVHDAGALAAVTVGTAAEAREAAAAGADLVVTQGWEAGGHVQGDVATMALVPRVADAVDVPVVAAGGIGDGRGIAAALALGADGAALGTRFLATEEADAHPAYQERVVAAGEADTQRTELFEEGWPGRPHRVLRNGTVERWEAAGRPPPGERPGETDVLAVGQDSEAITRYDEALATRDVKGRVEEMALYAGQSAGLAHDVHPAKLLVGTLVAETRGTIDRLGDLAGGVEP